MTKEPKEPKIVAPAEPLLPLVQEIRDLVQSARRAAAQNVNTLQVITNFEIGRRIVEHEQKGSRKAEYGERIVRELSCRLTEELGRGFSKSNLEYMRRFYLEYRETVPQIAQTLSGQSRVTPPVKAPIPQTVSAKLTNQFTLSWSHYVFLLNIGNRDERKFYEIESKDNQWSLSKTQAAIQLRNLRTHCTQPGQECGKIPRAQRSDHRKTGGRTQRSLCSGIPRAR